MKTPDITPAQMAENRYLTSLSYDLRIACAHHRKLWLKKRKTDADFVELNQLQHIIADKCSSDKMFVRVFRGLCTNPRNS